MICNYFTCFERCTAPNPMQVYGITKRGRRDWRRKQLWVGGWLIPSKQGTVILRLNCMVVVPRAFVHSPRACIWAPSLLTYCTGSPPIAAAWQMTSTGPLFGCKFLFYQYTTPHLNNFRLFGNPYSKSHTATFPSRTTSLAGRRSWYLEIKGSNPPAGNLFRFFLKLFASCW